MHTTEKVVYLCDWLPPDFGAVGQYELVVAQKHAQRGGHITLVGFNSAGDREDCSAKGKGCLRIHRVHRSTYNRHNWVWRSIWTLHSNLLLIWRARREILAADEIRFTGSPPFLIHFVMPVAAVLRKRTTYRISDFHPECLIAALGYIPWWVRPIHALTRFWRRRVTVFEALGEDQKQLLIAEGIPENKIQLRRDNTPVIFTGQETGRLCPEEMKGRFVVLYSGNWGRAHDAETFIRAVKSLDVAIRSRMGIWLNCIGIESKRVFEALKPDSSLLVKHTRPSPLKDLPEVLASADCHLITLKEAFAGFVLPSKVYGCIASAGSILYIGPSKSDVHMLCQQQASGRYHHVSCGDWIETRRVLESLVQEKKKRKPV